MLINNSLVSGNLSAALAQPLARLTANNPQAAGNSNASAAATSAANVAATPTPATANPISDLAAVSLENEAAANSITDPAVAEQVTGSLRAAILNQPALALLAQANPLPESILSLLQQ